MWTGKHPGLSFLKVWGCEAYVKRLMSGKLTPKSDKCFFVGYPRETKVYYFYNKAEGKVRQKPFLKTLTSPVFEILKPLGKPLIEQS